MTEKTAFTYAVFRYIHDTSTAEFINVGVVLLCPKHKFFGAKLRHTYRRLSAIFPDLDREAFRAGMIAIERALKSAGTAYQKDDLFRSDTNAAALARTVLPADDSSLQWSPVGSGLTADPEREVNRLYVRLVTNHDERHEHRKTDADIWRPVRERLDDAKLSSKLTRKTIQSSVDQLEFKHAWKNGVLHCYEPLSFDLADADGIKTKARRWTGHLTAVQDAADKFKTYFIVGAPSDGKLMSAYTDALAILRKSPVFLELFQEDELDTLVEKIETEIAVHD